MKETAKLSVEKASVLALSICNTPITLSLKGFLRKSQTHGYTWHCDLQRGTHTKLFITYCKGGLRVCYFWLCVL